MDQKVERSKLYIWLYSFKSFNALKKYGYIHYASRRMNYVVMYVNADEEAAIMKDLEALSFVRQVSRSPHKEIDMTFEHALDDWMDKVDKKNKNTPAGYENNQVL